MGHSYQLKVGKEAHKLELLVVYPSGRRYMLGVGKIDLHYVIKKLMGVQVRVQM